MKYLKPLLLSVLIFSSQVRAEDYQPLEVKFDQVNTADILDVTLLSATQGPYNGDTTVTLGISAIASKCEDYSHLQAFGGQTSLSDKLNPTDQYFRMITNWRPNCATGSFGEKTFKKVVLTFNSFRTNNGGIGVIHHLSFDSGMLAGFNRFKMYKLDLTDAANVKFDFVKQYSYVEGQVKDL